jgi:nucleoside-diphosphate-sugar epimerase
MNIIMTGATSFVGQASAREFLKRGHRVTAVVRPGSKNLSSLLRGNEEALHDGRLVIVENDLSEPEKLPEKIKEQGDVFCHFGWGGSGSGSRTDAVLQKKNYEDSIGMIGAAKTLGCSRFIFSGSQAEYGLHEAVITEETECSPRSLYGEAKLNMCIEGDALCRAVGMLYIHLRIFSAYGPGDHPWTLVESCLKASSENGELALGSCSQKWNFLYIDDLAKAVCALAETPGRKFKGLSNPVFNLAGSETRVLREFVEEIHEICGGKGTYVYNARQENAEGLIHLNPSIEKIKNVTGWIPETDFMTGIKKTMEASAS